MDVQSKVVRKQPNECVKRKGEDDRA